MVAVAIGVMAPTLGLRAPYRGLTSTAAIPACRIPPIDTSGWMTFEDEALHFTFRHPRAWERKAWADVSPGAPSGSEWWHESGPAWSFEFSRRAPLTDSARLAIYEHLPEFRQCLLTTSSGPVSVQFYRQGTAGYGARAVVLYNVAIDYPVDGSGTALHYEASSRDESRLFEELAIASTVRVRDPRSRR